jgi:uncharacterized LabA/DUF88 family protein
VFLDNSNIWIEAMKQDEVPSEEKHQLRINFIKMKEVLAPKQGVVASIAYISESAETADAQPQPKGWHVVKKRRKKSSNKEKEIDTQIVADITQLVVCNRESKGTIVLASGDGDMCPAVEKAANEGWNVEIYAWEHSSRIEDICKKYKNVICKPLKIELWNVVYINRKLKWAAAALLGIEKGEDIMYEEWWIKLKDIAKCSSVAYRWTTPTEENDTIQIFCKQKVEIDRITLKHDELQHVKSATKV